MSVRYLDLAAYVAIAVEVTGLDTDTVMRVASWTSRTRRCTRRRRDFGETEFFPDFVDKTAVLAVRLPRNHPLPDGNKRAAWVALRLFVDINGWAWNPRLSVDDAEHAMLAIASGEWGEGEMAAWLGRYLTEPRQG